LVEAVEERGRGGRGKAGEGEDRDELIADPRLQSAEEVLRSEKDVEIARRLRDGDRVVKTGQAGMEMAEELLGGKATDSEDRGEDAFEIFETPLEGAHVDPPVDGRGPGVIEKEMLDEALAVIRREP
jgi:hypothetical protein